MGYPQMRCSQLGLFAACPSSAGTCDIAIDSDSVPAREGSAMHEAAEALVAGMDPDMDAIAERWGVDADAIEYPTSQIGEWLGEMLPSLDRIEVEVEMDAGWLRGRADLIAVDGDGNGVVVDWKSGRVRRKNDEQLRGYAYLAMVGNDTPRVTAYIVHARLGEEDRATYTRAELDDWANETMSRRGMIGEQYVFGSHCEWCPRWTSCEAHHEAARAAAESMINIDPGMAPREALGSAWSRAKALRKALAKYDRAVDEALKSGPLETDVGVVALRAEVRDVIDPMAAGAILSDELTEDELSVCYKMSKTKVLGAVAAKAGKGRGAAEKRRVLALLRDGGAIGTMISWVRRETET